MKNIFSCKTVLINTESSGQKETLWNKCLMFVTLQYHYHQRSDVIALFHLFFFLSYLSLLRRPAGLCPRSSNRWCGAAVWYLLSMQIHSQWWGQRSVQQEWQERCMGTEMEKIREQDLCFFSIQANVFLGDNTASLHCSHCFLHRTAAGFLCSQRRAVRNLMLNSGARFQNMHSVAAAEENNVPSFKLKHNLLT